jgi:predicted Zn-dependent protease
MIPWLARSIVLNRAGSFQRATEAALKAVEHAPTEPFALSMAVHCISRSRGDPSAIAWFIERNFDVDAFSDDASRAGSVASLRANIAWSALKSGRIDMAEQVDRLSALALAAAPQAPAMEGTRGAWLVEHGSAAEGVPLLTRAARLTADPLDKAGFCHFLAKAMRLQGNEERAIAFDQVRLLSLSTGGSV